MRTFTCLYSWVKSADLTTELLKKPTGSSVNNDYKWAPERAAIICFTSGTSC